MTRLTADDMRGLIDGLEEFDADLRRVAGVGLGGLALHATGLRRDVLTGRRVAAVPVSTGQGFIPRFSECTAAILSYLGCDAFVTTLPDVRGLQEAAHHGAEAVFAADDHRFVALSLRGRGCADDDPCTARGYAGALELAAGGLHGRQVLLLGLGPVGRSAGTRLAELGARLLVADADAARAERYAAAIGAKVVGLEEGLAATPLVCDATPAADIIDVRHVTPHTIVAAPGIPPACSAAAREALGDRHIHEPLAIGVAVMAVEVLSGRISPRG